VHVKGSIETDSDRADTQQRRWLADRKISRVTDGPRQTSKRTHWKTCRHVVLKRKEVQASLTLNPEEFFFASALSRVAFKDDFDLL